MGNNGKYIWKNKRLQQISWRWSSQFLWVKMASTPLLRPTTESCQNLQKVRFTEVDNGSWDVSARGHIFLDSLWPLHIGGHCDRLVITSHPRPYRPYQANNWRIGRLLSSDLFSQGEDGNPAENSFFLGQVSAPSGAASRSSTGGIVGSWCRGSLRICYRCYLFVDSSVHLLAILYTFASM